MFNSNNTSNKEILFISSYPPRECGIATYSNDLIKAINEKFSSSFSVRICALEKDNEKLNYPTEVKYVFNESNRESYLHLANTINQDEAVKMVFIQHEFGLFGGEYGEYLLDLLYALKKPVSITFHTVLPAPVENRKKIVQALTTICEDVVVMTNQSASLLVDDYDVLKDKISIIPHGTHIVKYKNKEQLKKSSHFENRLILSTFGLLSSNKSIETALNALPEVISKFPNVLYIVLGKTHPGVTNHEGEIYRDFLEGTVIEKGLENNVLFVNKYLELNELLDYLSMTDIYLFTSKDPLQAVSGTFAYAMSSACPIISTPIPHAKELMSDETGILVDFQNSEQLSEAIIHLLSNDSLRNEMGFRAFQQTRAHVWPNSANGHAKLFIKHIDKEKLTFTPPIVQLDHIQSLTDDVGMIQFSKISNPDIDTGYTLDDNARALIAICQHYDLTKEYDNLNLIQKYLDFIDRCQQTDGSFLNYVDQDGRFHEQNLEVNLEDSNGRAIWALGVLIAHDSILPKSTVTTAKNIFEKSLNQIGRLKSPRSIAFAIKGLYFYNQTMNNAQINATIDNLAVILVERYTLTADDDWIWFEENLTYANSTLPEALLYAYLSTNNQNYKLISHLTFEFLLSHMFTDNTIKLISNNGWHQKHSTPNEYGEQPIDVSYTIQTLDLFYTVFEEEDYLNKIEIAFSWFLGNNHLNQIIYNPLTGGCYDGLEQHNVNLNQGAESSVCYLTARLIVERIKNDLKDDGHVSIHKTDIRIYNLNGRFANNNEMETSEILSRKRVS